MATWVRLRYPRVEWGEGLDVRPRLRLVQGLGAKVSFGDGCIVDHGMVVEVYGLLSVGRNVIFGHHCTLAANASLQIGDDCLIAEMVSIRDHDHAHDALHVPIRLQGSVSSPVKIGNNVWLGAKSTITRGVTIGDNVIVAAGAVVTTDVMSNRVVGGVPARILRERESPPE